MNSTRTIVFRLSHGKRKALIGGFIFTLAVLLVCIYWVYRIGLGAGDQALAQNKAISSELVGLHAALRREQQRSVSAEKIAEIDRLAAEAVRQELLAYRHKLAELQSDIEFYRRLMAPDELEKGLGLYAFRLSYDKSADSYQYSALVTQAGDQNQVIKGSLSIHLVAGPNDSSKLIAVESLPEFTGTLPARLRFRFFQTVEGSFKLPEDLTPVSITVKVASTVKSAQKINKTFNWIELLGDR